MATLEASLSNFEERISEAQKAANALTKALRKIKKAAGAGHLLDMEKAAASIAQRAQQAQSAASELPDAWNFDSRAYLEHGYVAELKQEADAQGLRLVEKDGRLYCFPIVIKLEPREVTARIGTKREARLRPKDLVRQLAAMQKAKPRNSQKFIDALYQVYRHVQGAKWKGASGPGPAMPLAQIYDLLTLLPLADYPIEEFARDLLLLARQPETRTRDGCSFDFTGSTMSKERVKRISVYDEEGLEKTFIGLRFNRDE